MATSAKQIQADMKRIMQTSKLIQLPHGINLTVEKRVGSKIATAITCDEMQVCPGCGLAFCYFDCDGSQAVDEEHTEFDDDTRDRIENNCRIEGVLLFIQNLYAFGFDQRIEQMKSAIESTMNDITNRE